MSEALDKLRKRLIYLHDTCNIPWRKMPLLVDFEGIPFGTLWDIAHGHEPTNPILRDRLGLPPKETCGMCYVFNTYIGKAREEQKSKQIHQWREMSTKRLKLALEHREEVIYGEPRHNGTHV